MMKSGCSTYQAQAELDAEVSALAPTRQKAVSLVRSTGYPFFNLPVSAVTVDPPHPLPDAFVGRVGSGLIQHGREDASKMMQVERWAADSE